MQKRKGRTALVVTGDVEDVEDKLQRLQWRPGQSVILTTFPFQSRTYSVGRPWSVTTVQWHNDDDDDDDDEDDEDDNDKDLQLNLTSHFRQWQAVYWHQNRYELSERALCDTITAS